jgi:hypothetical protein
MTVAYNMSDVALTNFEISSTSFFPVEFASTVTDCLLSSSPFVKVFASLIFKLILPEEVKTERASSLSRAFF